MFYRTKRIIKSYLLPLLIEKRSTVSKQGLNTYHLDKGQVEYVFSTNYILRIKFADGTIKYFRESRVHMDFKQYIFTGLEDYFYNIYPYDNGIEYLDSILNDLKDPVNFDKLCNIESVYREYFSQMCSGSFCDFNKIGLPSIVGLDFRGEGIHFLQFVKSLLFSYNRNIKCKIGSYETFNNYRTIATRKLAEILGLDFIPQVEFCAINVSGIERVGVLMESAGNESPAYLQLEDRHNIFKPDFLKCLTTLEYFDHITYQLDHRLDNYCILRNNKSEICGISVFDNDEAHAFYFLPFLASKTYAGCSGVMSKRLIDIKRPYIDYDFFVRLNTIRFSVLKCSLEEYLTSIQLYALWIRLKTISFAARKKGKKNNNFFVNNWNSIDQNIELNKQEYGITYFYLYWNDTGLLDRSNSLGG